MLQLEDVKEFLDVLSNSSIGRGSRWYFWLVALCFLSAYAAIAILDLIIFSVLGQLALIACCVGPLWLFYFDWLVRQADRKEKMLRTRRLFKHWFELQQAETLRSNPAFFAPKQLR